MSSTPTVQGDGAGGQTPVPASQAGDTATPAAGQATPARRFTRSQAAAARYGPLAAAAAAMTGFGLWGLARDSAMGNDEVVSRWAALLSLHQLVHLVMRVDAEDALYYLLLHGWMVVGTSPAAIRVPSVIGMSVAAVLVVILGRRLTGSAWAGLFAGLIMALTPTISFYAQTARSYAWVFACVVAETLILLYALRGETTGLARAQIKRRWLAYGALVTLCAYLHEMSLLVLAAHGITVLLTRYGRRVLVHWAVTGAVAVVLAAPVIAASAHQGGSAAWIPRPTVRDLWILYHDYFGATVWAPVLVAACAVVALLPPRGTWRRYRAGAAADAADAERPWWRSGGISLPSVAAPLLVVPAALLMIESLIATPLYVDRYVLYGEAGAALLAGAGLCRIGRWLAAAAHRPQLIWVPGVVVCVCALLLQLAPQQRVRTPGSRLYNFGGPAFYVAANAQPGDGVLFFTAFYRKAELGYPSQFAKTRDIALAVSPAVRAPYQGINKPFAAVRPLMLAEHRIWVLGQRPAASGPPGEMQQESAVLQQYFTQTVQQGYKGLWLTLWVRR